MKSQWKVVLAALVLGLGIGGPGKVLAQTCGDINNDGTVNPLDAVCMAGCVAGGGTCPSSGTLPQCGPGPICGSGNLADCGDIVGDGILTLPELQSDLSNLSLSLTGAETLYGLCADGRAGASNECPNKIGHCSGDNQTACSVDQDCVDQGTTGPCVAGCGSGGTVTYGSFTIDETVGWPPAPGCIVKLNGTVFVQTNSGAAADTVLCVEAGTTVQGVKGSIDPAALILLTSDEGGDPDIPDRKAKVDWRGTPASPIVFTSDQTPGTRGKGDWAGIQFNGLSTVNRNYNVNPALNKCFAQGEGIPAPFGGCIEDDSSGIATYVRAEYCGLDFTPNNELNVWTMNGIGSGTRFDHIQATVGDDDCFEWFGGTSNHKYLLASACGDDGLDFQLGFTGSVQFAAYIQAGDLTDTVPGRDCRGIEADNSEYDNNALPRSNPVFCNVTIMGESASGTDNGGSDAGMMLRRGLAGKFVNMIVAGHNDNGVEIRDAATTVQAMANPTTLNAIEPVLQVRNSMFHDNGSGNVEQCKRDVCKDAAGDSPNSLCTGSGSPFACCTGSETGTCNTTCDYTSECAGGAPDGSFTYCNIGGGTASTCDWYDQLVANEGVVPPTQTSLDGTGAFDNQLIDEHYPAPGNLYDTTVPIDPGSFTLIPPGTCSDLNESLVDVNYVGAFDPSAGCTPSTGPCDWLSKPWISFAKN